MERRAGETNGAMLNIRSRPNERSSAVRRSSWQGREEKRRGAKFKAGPSKIAGQKKAPAGEDRRALLTGEGRKSGQSPAVATEL